MAENPMNKLEYNQDKQKTDANNYDQKGSLGFGHQSGGEIKDRAKVAGQFNEYNAEKLIRMIVKPYPLTAFLNLL